LTQDFSRPHSRWTPFPFSDTRPGMIYLFSSRESSFFVAYDTLFRWNSFPLQPAISLPPSRDAVGLKYPNPVIPWPQVYPVPLPLFKLTRFAPSFFRERKRFWTSFLPRGGGRRGLVIPPFPSRTERRPFFFFFWKTDYFLQHGSKGVFLLPFSEPLQTFFYYPFPLSLCKEQGKRSLPKFFPRASLRSNCWSNPPFSFPLIVLPRGRGIMDASFFSFWYRVIPVLFSKPFHLISFFHNWTT